MKAKPCDASVISPETAAAERLRPLFRRNNLGLLSISAVLLVCGAFLLLFFLSVVLPWREEINLSPIRFSDETCDYPGCEESAAYDGQVVLSASEARRIPEREGYELEWNTYTRTETGLLPETDTYLVPTDKGFRVEKDRHWKEFTYEDGQVTYAVLSGAYCAAHRAEGQALLQSAVDRAYLWASPLFWLCVLIPALGLVLLAVYPARHALAFRLARKMCGNALPPAMVRAGEGVLREEMATRRAEKRQTSAGTPQSRILPVLLGGLLAAAGVVLGAGGVLPNLESEGVTTRTALLAAWIAGLGLAGLWLLLAGLLAKPFRRRHWIGPVLLLAVAAVCFLGFFRLTYA